MKGPFQTARAMAWVGKLTCQCQAVHVHAIAAASGSLYATRKEIPLVTPRTPISKARARRLASRSAEGSKFVTDQACKWPVRVNVEDYSSSFIFLSPLTFSSPPTPP